MATSTSVAGIYPDRAVLLDAINVLNRAGLRATATPVLPSENAGEKHRKTPGGAIGAASGAVTGAALAWLVAIQAVTITGLMPLVAAGTALAALAGAAVGGPLGFIAGVLVGLLRAVHVAKRSAGKIRHGGILVSVHCDSPEWCDRATKTLISTGARNICVVSGAPAQQATHPAWAQSVTQVFERSGT